MKPREQDALKQARHLKRRLVGAEEAEADAAWHSFLCHPGEACADGCDAAAAPDRLAAYRAVAGD